MVAAPHRGDRSLSIETTFDENSATGGRQLFVSAISIVATAHRADRSVSIETTFDENPPPAVVKRSIRNLNGRGSPPGRPLPFD